MKLIKFKGLIFLIHGILPDSVALSGVEVLNLKSYYIDLRSS